MQETEKTVRRRGNKLFQGLLEGEEVGALCSCLYLKHKTVKLILLMPKWNFWNPVAKFYIDRNIKLLQGLLEGKEVGALCS